MQMLTLLTRALITREVAGRAAGPWPQGTGDVAPTTDTLELSPQASDALSPAGSPQPDFGTQYAYGTTVDFTQGYIPAGYGVGNDTFHGGNGELQQYSPSQVTPVAGQGVVLTAAPNPNPGVPSADGASSPYVSGKLFDTQRGVSTGAVEFTATIPKGSGLWPAMWLLPKGQNGADGSDAEWPRTGEIDVSEIKGTDTRTSLATLHWGDAPGVDQSPGAFATAVDGATDFADGQPHKFAAQWDGNGITSYVDGRKMGFQAFDEKQKAIFASGQQFSPIINLAVGGKFDGSLYDPNNPAWRDQVKAQIDGAGTFANGQTPSMTVSSVSLYTNDPASASTFEAPVTPAPPGVPPLSYLDPNRRGFRPALM